MPPEQRSPTNITTAPLLLLLALLLVVLVGPAASQGTAKGPVPSVAPELDQFLTRNGEGAVARRPPEENSFSVALVSSANNTYFAGQEIRIRVSTTLFNTEQFRHSAKTAPFHGETPHNARVPLVRYFRRHNASLVQERNVTLFPGFNITGPSSVRIRVVPAYAGRAESTGAAVPCRDQTDVWAEIWGLSGRTFAWGKSIAFSAYATFTVPPFQWKLCVKDVSLRNHTNRGRNLDLGRNWGWREFDNMPGVQSFREPLFRYVASDRMHAEDYAAIQVIANGREHRTWNHRTFDPHDHRMSDLNRFRGDQIKLVPSGLPCTYEKASATADLIHNTHPVLATTKSQYCGSNYIKAGSGDFVTEGCVAEGSVEGGVGFTGSQHKNPWAAHTPPAVNEMLPSGVEMVGYFRLPRPGKYDICFSPVNYRLALLNVSLHPSHDMLVHGVPVWFKLYRSPAAFGCPQTSQAVEAPCPSYTTQIDVTDGVTGPNAHGLVWDATDTSAGTWGAVEIRSTNGILSLNANPAVTWEYSDPRQYVTTTGGDQFRLVAEEHFAVAEQTVFGDLYARPGGERLKTMVQVCEGPSCTQHFETVNRIDSHATSEDHRQASAGNTVQYQLLAPGEGTVATGAGCFATDDDNFGSTRGISNGEVGAEMCCSPGAGGACEGTGCARTDVGSRGVTASGDLGRNPRLPLHPWHGDGDGLTSVWAYLRFPQTGRFRVCYRQAGTNNWRVIPRAGNRGVTLHPTRAFSTSNFTYHLNDTAARSLGMFAVHALQPVLSMQPHSYNAPLVPLHEVVGSSLKIVEWSESCHTSSGLPVARSSDAGSAECTFAECGHSDQCAGCLGFADDDPTPTRTVYFYLRIPDDFTTTSEYYRVCFQKGSDNWIQLSNPTYVRHQLATSADRLSPQSSQVVEYDMVDRREGTWGRFIFRRQRAHAPRLSALPGPVGDAVRLIVNESITGVPTTCATQWGADAAPGSVVSVQAFVAALSVNDVGIACTTAGSSSACATELLAPTSALGTNGLHPYTTLNSRSDVASIADVDGSVAFLRLPPAHFQGREASYRVCYRQGARNWVEAVPRGAGTQLLALRSARRINASVAHIPHILAGMYDYIHLTAPPGAEINPWTDLIKLVDDARSCDREAAGGLSARNLYSSLAGSGHNVRGGARIVDGTSNESASASIQGSSLTNVRYYLTFPLLDEPATLPASGEHHHRQFKVCYMRRTSNTQTDANWDHLTTIVVHSTGLVYDAISSPVRGSVFDLRLVSTFSDHKLNTLRDVGDRAKLVADGDPCSTGTAPFGVSSLDLRLQLAAAGDAARTAGLADLGPSDEEMASVASVTLTLPHTTAFLKVCYRAANRGENAHHPWVEVPQVAVAAHTVPLIAGSLNTVPSGVASFTASASIRSLDPGVASQQQYAPGLPITSTFVGGATGTLTFSPEPGTVLAAADSVKLVLLARETSRGVWEMLPGTSCRSPASLTMNMVSAGSATGTLPTVAGRYLVCYAFAGSATWIEVRSADSAYANPITVISSNLLFRVTINSVTNANVTVLDQWTDGVQGLGGVAASDLLYFVNRSDTCGIANAFNGQTIAAAAALLQHDRIGDAAPVTAGRVATVAWLNAVVVGSSFWAKPCYYKSQRDTAASAALPALQSFMPVGWYEMSSLDSPAQSPFYSFAAATRVVLDSCPPFSLSSKIRTGESFTVTASIQNANGDIVPFDGTRFAHLVRVVGNSLLFNTRGKCAATSAADFGWLPSNLQQFTSKGIVTFVLSPRGPCPESGCQFHLEVDGLQSSATCTFDVLPTPAYRVQMISAPQSAHVEKPVSFRLVVFAEDGRIAHAANDTVYASIADAEGIIARSGPQLALGADYVAVGAVEGGYFVGNLTLEIDDVAAFTSDRVINVSFRVAGVALSAQVLVYRPFISAVHIVDLYPDQSASVARGEATWLPEGLVPSWEPLGTTSSFFGGGFDVVSGASVVEASPGYHLAAQQYYTAVLRLVVSTTAGVSGYASSVALLSEQQRLVSLHLSSHEDGNALLEYAPDCHVNTSCGEPHSGVTFDSPMQKVTFRLRSSIGCSNMNAPCNITFRFGGQELGGPTMIQTPVRSVATKLAVTCHVNPQSAALPLDWAALAATASTAGCGTSTIERGWVLVVKAVDEFGVVDEFFEGHVMTSLRRAPQDTTTTLTTVASLADGTETLEPVRAVAGVAVLPFVTLSRPCDGPCTLQLISDWGTEIADIGPLRVTPSTHRLQCSLATSLVSCNVSAATGDCEAIAGNFTYDAHDASRNANAAIYPDTQLCVDVKAVSEDGEPTLYDTVWVHYHLTDVADGAQLVVTDTDQHSDFRKRYRAMRGGQVRFCFSVAGSFVGAAATFALRFAAQRFATPGHWTVGETGECSLGTFSVFARKSIARLAVTQVYRDAVALVPLPTRTPHMLFTRRASAKSELIFDMRAEDHYGNPVLPAQLLPAEEDLEVVLDHCNVTGLSSTCVSGSLESVPGSDRPGLTTLSDPRVMGALIVQLPITPRSAVREGNLQYTIHLDKFCVGCFIALRLKHPGDVEHRVFDPTTGGTDVVKISMELSVLLMANNEVKRMVSFAPGRSPTRYWREWQETIPGLTGTLMFNESCVVDPELGCSAIESNFLHAVCDSRPTSVLHSNADGAPIEMLVSIAELPAARNRYYESACANNNCVNPANYQMQADILSTFVVGMSAGSQRFQCLDSAGCVDDGTSTPKKVIEAFGATAREAVLAFKAAGYVPRTAAFSVAGLVPSDFYESNLTDGRFLEASLPSRGGRLRGTSSNNQPEVIMETLQTDLALLWRGATRARGVAFLDISDDASCPASRPFSCLTDDDGPCPYDGHTRMASGEEIGFNYSSGDAVAATPFPLTIDVVTADGARTFGARGQLALALDSWGGCNDGGQMTVTGSLALDNGRASVLVSFSAPCERCVLRATLTPSNLQPRVYAGLLRNPANLIAYSRPFNVRPSLPPATNVLVSSPPASLPSTVTVADVLSVDLETVTRVGRMAVVTDSEPAKVALYNAIHTTPFNHWWYGNGGVLRASPTAPAGGPHHAATATVAGKHTVTFMFTRTCSGGCRVMLCYELPGSRGGTFALRNSDPSGKFVVVTQPSGYLVLGGRPRVVRAGTDFAVAAWHIGSEASDIPIAGVAASGFPLPSTASRRVNDLRNGDGGVFTSTAFALQRSEVHRMRFTRPCNNCSFVIGGLGYNVVVRTVATRLAVTAAVSGAGGWQGSFPSDATLHFDVAAVDDDGFVDVLYGGSSNCLLYPPFFCTTAPRNLSATLISSTEQPLPSSMRPFASLAPTVDGRLSDGRQNVSVTFPTPVRLGLLRISSDSLHGTSERPVQISSAAAAFAKATGAASAASVPAFVKTTVRFALVRDLTSPSGSFIVSDAFNAISFTFEDCPPRLLQGSVGFLTAGLAEVDITFSNPPGASQACTIRATVASAPSSRCDPCTASVTVTVSRVVASGARFVAPSRWDNDGAEPGPRFGAAGRRMVVALQITGSTSGGSVVDVPTCDDPATANTVETCELAIAPVSGACTHAPRVTGDARASVNGVVTLTLEWALVDSAVAPYSCEVKATVRRAGTTTIHDTTHAVTVCRPSRLAIVTNLTRTSTFFTGVPYPMFVAVQDAGGRRCFGESQGDATELTLDVVSATSHTPTPMIHVINVNATRWNDSYPSLTAAEPARASKHVRVISGGFMLNLVFTNSSSLNGLDGIRVRIASAVGTVLSPPIDTAIAATRLAFRHAARLPRHAVTGRALFLPGGAPLVVEAADAVDPLWVELGLIPDAPNVATRARDVGSNAAVSWIVRPPGGLFPLTFATGSRDMQLVAGRAAWAGATWVGPDATVTLSVRAATGVLTPTREYTVTFQSLQQLVVDTSHFLPEPFCHADGCALPGGNASLPPGHGFSELEGGTFSTQNLRWFPFRASFLDPVGQVVEGEREAVVEITLEGSGTGSVRLAAPTDFAANGSHFLRASAGRVAFNLSFVGTTGDGDETVRIVVRCPPTRPHELLLEGEVSSENPCFNQLAPEAAVVRSAPIVVRESRPSQSYYEQPEVLARLPIIKVRSLLNAISEFPLAAFARDVSLRLHALGIFYISPTNADGVVDALACLVARDHFGNADLGASVCGAVEGSEGRACDLSGTNNDTCPHAVLMCSCGGVGSDASAAAQPRSSLLRRYLLQTTTPASVANGSDVQLELSFALWRAPRFAGRTQAEVNGALTRLGILTEDLIRSDAELRETYSIDVNSVMVRAAGDPLVLAPAPTPAPTPQPTPEPTPEPTLPSTAARRQLGSIAETLLMALLGWFAWRVVAV